MKVCTKCKVNKKNEEFYVSSNQCKDCKDASSKQWRIDNPVQHKENMRRLSLMRTYGITPEQYDELLDKQNYSCYICERHESVFDRRMAVDHNHKTGEIRGLLCSYCNHRVVGRHRDGDLLRKIADYIEQGTGWFVPPKKPKRKRRTKVST